jgi:anti-sigma B factor antagonist
MSIELRSESNDSAAVIYCSGEVKSGEEGRRLRETVAEWLHRRRQVIVDLSHVRYMDSGGLGILVSLYPIARIAGATLKYVNLITPVDYSRAARQP